MVKYEPYFFIDSTDRDDISKKKQRGPVLCKDDPLTACSFVENILNRFIGQEQKDIMILEENKAQILPGKLQEKVNLVALRAETLILKTNSSVWRAEIMSKKSGIIAVCNVILGKTAVKSVKFV